MYRKTNIVLRYFFFINYEKIHSLTIVYTILVKIFYRKEGENIWQITINLVEIFLLGVKIT